MSWCIVWTSCLMSLIFYFIHTCNELKKWTYKNKTLFYLQNFLAVLTVLTIIIELCWYPGCLFAVPPDNVEVCKQVQGNLHKELKAKQGQDTEVDVGQLGRKRLVGQIPRRLRHFFPWVTERVVWVIMKTGSNATSITDEWSWFSLRELTSWLGSSRQSAAQGKKCSAAARASQQLVQCCIPVPVSS